MVDFEISNGIRKFTSSYHLVVWTGCFGFNGPLRQYFSLYRAAVVWDDLYFEISSVDYILSVLAGQVTARDDPLVGGGCSCHKDTCTCCVGKVFTVHLLSKKVSAVIHGMFLSHSFHASELTLLYSERPKLFAILDFLSTIVLFHQG